MPRSEWKVAKLLEHVDLPDPMWANRPSLVQHARIVKKLKATKARCDSPEDVQEALLENHTGPVERAYAGSTTYIPKGYLLQMPSRYPVEDARQWAAQGYAVVNLRSRLIARVDRPDWQAFVEDDNCHTYRLRFTQDTRAVPRAVADVMPMSEYFTVGYVEKTK